MMRFDKHKQLYLFYSVVVSGTKSAYLQHQKCELLHKQSSLTQKIKELPMSRRILSTWRSFVASKRSLVAGAILVVLALVGGLMVSANGGHDSSSGVSQGFQWPLNFLGGHVTSYRLNVRVHRGVPSDPTERAIYLAMRDQHERLQRLNREANPTEEFQREP